jgi:hypothetical protein
VAAALFALAACNGNRAGARAPLVDSAPAGEADPSGRLMRELELEVMSSYQRPSLDAAAAAAVVDASVGLTVFGVGPGNVAIGRALDERWPVVEVLSQRPGEDRVGEVLEVDVVSHRLELFMSADATVGWSYDDVSLRLPVCGRIASIPLRVAQVYVRDSERWTLVAEHVAYAQPMGRWLDGAKGPDGAKVATAVERQLESEAAQAALRIGLAPDGDREVWDGGPGGLALWPDPLHVMRGGAARSAPSLAQTLGATAVTVEGLRLALGPTRSVAIANGTLIAALDRDTESGAPLEVRLRGTFVLERFGDDWRIRLAMVSTPITIGALVGRSLGTVANLAGGGRVAMTCR